jgi:hypothetical protein
MQIAPQYTQQLEVFVFVFVFFFERKKNSHRPHLLFWYLTQKFKTNTKRKLFGHSQSSG